MIGKLDSQSVIGKLHSQSVIGKLDSPWTCSVWLVSYTHPRLTVWLVSKTTLDSSLWLVSYTHPRLTVWLVSNTTLDSSLWLVSWTQTVIGKSTSPHSSVGCHILTQRSHQYEPLRLLNSWNHSVTSGPGQSEVDVTVFVSLQLSVRMARTTSSCSTVKASAHVTCTRSSSRWRTRRCDGHVTRPFPQSRDTLSYSTDPAPLQTDSKPNTMWIHRKEMMWCPKAGLLLVLETWRF